MLTMLNGFSIFVLFCCMFEGFLNLRQMAPKFLGYGAEEGEFQWPVRPRQIPGPSRPQFPLSACLGVLPMSHVSLSSEAGGPSSVLRSGPGTVGQGRFTPQPVSTRPPNICFPTHFLFIVQLWPLLGGPS